MIVATPVLPDDQAPPDIEELNVVVPLEHKVCVPLSVPALVDAVTVTVLVDVALEHPPVPVIVYVIVAVPAVTPVTTPVELLIVATPVAFDDHAPPDTLELNVVVPSEHNVCVPLSVPTLGAAVTVTVLVAVALEHPPVPVIV